MSYAEQEKIRHKAAIEDYRYKKANTTDPNMKRMYADAIKRENENHKVALHNAKVMDKRK